MVPPTLRSTRAQLERGRRAALGVALGLALVLALGACRGGPALLQLAEAQSLAADLRVQVSQAADASNRAVMADTDAASISFAAEAQASRKAARADSTALMPLLRALDASAEVELLTSFDASFAEYEALDGPILELAVENTNLKAQALSFGPGREAADALRAALESVERASSARTRCQVAALVSAAVLAVREIEVLEAPHIAEVDDAAMSRLEKQMDDRDAIARASLRDLGALVDAGAAEPLAAATAALDRFRETHARLVALSRKNTNVRSLAMALGQKRAATAACDARLAALADALARQGVKATR